MPASRHHLPPTSETLRDYATHPYLLWWTEASVGDLKAHLASADSVKRAAYWMGALLREANTRDVWRAVLSDLGEVASGRSLRSRAGA
jgi:hypothetical protein